MVQLTLPLKAFKEEWFRSNVEPTFADGCHYSHQQTTWVYTLLGEIDFLYIGSTGNLARRLSAHRGQKPWWPEIEKVTAELICCRQHAREAEAYQIGFRRPLHNSLFPEEGRVFVHDWVCMGFIGLDQFEF